MDITIWLGSILVCETFAARKTVNIDSMVCCLAKAIVTWLVDIDGDMKLLQAPTINARNAHVGH